MTSTKENHRAGKPSGSPQTTNAMLAPQTLPGRSPSGKSHAFRDAWNPYRGATVAALLAGKAAILADIADITARPDGWDFPDGSKAVLNIYMADIEAELTRRSRLRLPPERSANYSADAIKKRVDIVQIAERYAAKLRKVGSRYRARCPKHDGESDTSLSIDAEQQLFYCFGCQIGGDVFDLLMWVAGCDFPGAIQLACIEAGIPKMIPENDSRPKGIGNGNHFAVRGGQVVPR
ncbi:MAG: CHC2 zinc finger domain-containing protein [Thermomicrobiales bacterium]